MKSYKMAETYVIEYYLPNQSHLFSEPQRVMLRGKDRLQEAQQIAQRNGYDVIAVYEVQGEGYFVPIN